MIGQIASKRTASALLDQRLFKELDVTLFNKRVWIKLNHFTRHGGSMNAKLMFVYIGIPESIKDLNQRIAIGLSLYRLQKNPFGAFEFQLLGLTIQPETTTL